MSKKVENKKKSKKPGKPIGPKKPRDELYVDLEDCLGNFPDLTWGHKWTFVYEPGASLDAYVDVAIVLWNKSTYKFASQVSNYSLRHPIGYSTTPTSIIFDLNLKANIDYTYDYFHIPLDAPPAENYPAFAIETIGSWSAAGHALHALHDSFRYKIRRVPGTSDIAFDADFRGKVGRGPIMVDSSRPVTPPALNRTYGMGLHLDYWKSVWVEPASKEPAKVKAVDYYIWEDDASVDEYFLNRSPLLDEKNGVRFVLTPSPLELTVSSNFDLEKFIVDPKGFGSGGNGG
ncbi:MAG: hypothetical protein AAF633_17950 [Chloroflexota bacterium]